MFRVICKAWIFEVYWNILETPQNFELKYIYYLKPQTGMLAQFLSLQLAQNTLFATAREK
jgi:hypothetical protein